MIARLVLRALWTRRAEVALMIASVAAGTTVITTFGALAFDIEDQVAHELRSFGANIIIEPRIEGPADLVGQRRFLNESDLPRAKTVFWRNNILGIAPLLDTDVSIAGQPATLVGTWDRHELPHPGRSGTFAAGMETVTPGWTVEGEGLADGVYLTAAVSDRMGKKPGDTVKIDDRRETVRGRVGGGADGDAFEDLSTTQARTGRDGQVSRVLVSSITAPMDDFALRDPLSMTATELEKWNCTGYATSIASQLEAVFSGAQARPIWRVAQAEGQVLSRLRGLFQLLSFGAFLASVLAVSATLAGGFLRRRREIAVMKSIGADATSMLTLFGLEAAFIGAAGGIIGLVVSAAVIDQVGAAVFGTALSQPWYLIPLALCSATAISVTGALLPLRSAFALKPAEIFEKPS